MRTVHSDLTTAQQSASPTPYVRLNFRSRNRVTTRTYDTTGNRILMVRQVEGRLGGKIGVPGTGYSASAAIRLNDWDSSLIALTWVGYRLDIGWGYNTASGNRYSEGEPLIVVRQASGSEGGHISLELYCMSLWDMLDIYHASAAAAGFKWGTKYVATNTSVRHILMEMFAAALEGEGEDYAGMGAAISADYNAVAPGTVFVSETAASKDVTANDVELLPAAPAVNDAFYVGFVNPFDRISIDLTIPGVGTWTVTHEYWNGSAWAALTYTDSDGSTGVKDGTTGFTVGELKIVAFDRPTDWATVNLSTTDPDGTAGNYAAIFPNSSLYYVRARVTAFTAITTRPEATRIFVAQDFGIALDTNNAAQGDDRTPQYLSQTGSILSIIEDILEYTELGIVLKKDGFHAQYIDSAGSVDYTYGGAHRTYLADLGQGQALPNRIEYTDEAADPAITALSNDAASQTAFGVVYGLKKDESATTNAIAQTQADATIARLQRDKSQGEVFAPLSTNQEMWDLVRVEDSRTGQNFNGRLSQIVREYVPGQYSMRLAMGGINVDWVLSRPNRDIILARQLQPIANVLDLQGIDILRAIESGKGVFIPPSMFLSRQPLFPVTPTGDVRRDMRAAEFQRRVPTVGEVLTRAVNQGLIMPSGPISIGKMPGVTRGGPLGFTSGGFAQSGGQVVKPPEPSPLQAQRNDQMVQTIITSTGPQDVTTLTPEQVAAQIQEDIAQMGGG